MAKYEINVTVIEDDGTRKPWDFNGEPTVVTGEGFVCIGLTEVDKKVRSHVTMENVSLDAVATVLSNHPILSKATREAAFTMMGRGMKKEDKENG